MLIRPFADADAEAVRTLFVRINRDLAPDTMRAAFEAYVARSLHEEIDRIADYYATRDGSFWVAEEDGLLLGMFGLERVAADAAELRRMYVAPQAQRRGIARAMLRYAEQVCRDAGLQRLVLSTSELQQAALALYRASGFHQVCEEVAETQTNRTVGAGLWRFHFEKRLESGDAATTAGSHGLPS